MAKLMVNPMMRGFFVATWVATSSLVAAAPPLASPPQQGFGEFVVRQSEGAPTLSIGGTVFPYKEDTLAADIHWMRGRTLYAVVGDVPWWLFVAGSLAVSFWRRRSPRRAA